MDETRVQCTREIREPITANTGHSKRYDAKYERNGVAHMLAFYAPLEKWRRVDVADSHAALHRAEGVRALEHEDYPQAKRVILVMDNLNTHNGASM